MIYQKLPICPKGCCEGRSAEGFAPTLTAYIPDNSPEINEDRLHRAVVLCPGGGYAMTSDREAEPVALKLLGEGYAVFVLRYSVAPATFPTALVEVATAVALVREQAQAWQIDPDHIVVGGFSAGGHLAASLGVFWNTPYLAEQSGLTAEQCRPNGLLLSYPVITSGKESHPGSFDNLLADREGEAYDKGMQQVSLEHQVTASMPRTFLWHTFNDNTVPVANSLLLASAMNQAGVPFELHIFPDGVHGLSLCNSLSAKDGLTDLVNPTCEAWFDLFLKWLAH